MQIWGIALLILAGSIFLFALAVMVFVAYRALALIAAIDAQVLRELLHRPVASGINPANSILRNFGISEEDKTDGDFVVNSEEEYAVQEQLRKMQADGLGYLSPEDEAELAARMRQGGVSASV